MELIYGNVPHPAYEHLIVENSTAWDDLGERTIVGACVHRMDGSLWGTDGYFRNEGTGAALTDYRIGGEMRHSARAGGGGVRSGPLDRLETRGSIHDPAVVLVVLASLRAGWSAAALLRAEFGPRPVVAWETDGGGNTHSLPSSSAGPVVATGVEPRSGHQRDRDRAGGSHGLGNWPGRFRR